VGAVLNDPAEVAEQALAIARDGAVRARDGSLVRLLADTLCVHGDTPGAVENARAVKAALESAGIVVRSLYA